MCGRKCHLEYLLIKGKNEGEKERERRNYVQKESVI